MPETGATPSPVPAVEDAINRFRLNVESGKSWHMALLETARDWPVSEETVGEQTYRYIIAGEALDLLQIAERLISAAGNVVPEDEKVNFLFHNQPPVTLTAEQVRATLGENRFGQYLNFFYGVTAEEALVQAVEEEVRKEEQGINIHSEAQIIDETFRRVYDESHRALLRQFRKEKNYSQTGSITLEQIKEFSYWRFKYRLKRCEKARVASDTQKALNWMKRNSR
jgi:hypothetical protein